jgi:hypothetical protein
MINPFIDKLLMGIEGALASFLNSALGFSPTLFLALPEMFIYWTEFISPNLYMRPFPSVETFACQTTCIYVWIEEKHKIIDVPFPLPIFVQIS